MKFLTKTHLKSKVCHLAAGGLFLAVFGIIMVCYGFPKITKRLIQKDAMLKEGTDGFSFWKNPPVPTTFKVYFFNVTNPEEVSKGSRPKLNEIGPFVYKKHLERHNIRFEDDKLTYDLKKIYHFDQEASGNLTESDQVTILNVALVGIAITVKQIFSAGLSGLNKLIPDLFDSPETPFMTASVADILFDGTFVNCSSSSVAMVCKAMKARLPPTVREDAENQGYLYSMFHHLNNTLEGPYTVNTGEFHVDKLGEITHFQNESTLGVWEESCDDIKGTDTSVFAPMDDAKPPKRIYIFQPDLCRVMYAEFKKKKLAFDLPAIRYETTKSVLESGKTNPENTCYCDSNWSGITDGCALNGVLDLNQCQQAPVVASFPHFYLADEKLKEYIEEGLHPDKNKHETFVEIEPNTGAPLRGAKRIQFNMELQKITQISLLRPVTQGLFPFIWVEESAEADEASQDFLKGIYTTVKVLKAIQWMIVVAGIIMVLASIHLKRKSAGETWSLSPVKVDVKKDEPKERESAKSRSIGFNNESFMHDSADVK